MSGLMRYQSSGLLEAAGSRGKRSSSKRLLGTRGIALLCLVAGYFLGCYHAPRMNPYPIDMVGVRCPCSALQRPCDVHLAGCCDKLKPHAYVPRMLDTPG